MTLQTALLRLAASSRKQIFERWNWKAALFSSLVRGFIFLFANLRSGWRAAAGAMLAEWLFRAATSGYYGAITQALGEVEPEWQAIAGAMVLLPLLSHSLEFLLHRLRHTPHLAASLISSITFTMFSTLFNLYAMRRGSMVVGRGAPSLADDMRGLPCMIGGFLAVLPIWAWRSLRGLSA